jgi:hypothetical protein
MVSSRRRMGWGYWSEEGRGCFYNRKLGSTWDEKGDWRIAG